MTTRWQVEQAVRISGLPAPARHVLLTLATWSTAATAAIPARYTPSLTGLAGATGLGRSTVARHLDQLERDGWIVRTRPPVEQQRRDHERTRYRLCIPAALAAELVPQRDQGDPAPGPAWSRSGTELVPQRDTTKPRTTEPVEIDQPPCGQCGPNRQIETAAGVARCPVCHPLRQERSA